MRQCPRGAAVGCILAALSATALSFRPVVIASEEARFGGGVDWGHIARVGEFSYAVLLSYSADRTTYYMKGTNGTLPAGGNPVAASRRRGGVAVAGGLDDPWVGVVDQDGLAGRTASIAHASGPVEKFRTLQPRATQVVEVDDETLVVLAASASGPVLQYSAYMRSPDGASTLKLRQPSPPELGCLQGALSCKLAALDTSGGGFMAACLKIQTDLQDAVVFDVLVFTFSANGECLYSRVIGTTPDNALELHKLPDKEDERFYLSWLAGSKQMNLPGGASPVGEADMSEGEGVSATRAAHFTVAVLDAFGVDYPTSDLKLDGKDPLAAELLPRVAVPFWKGDMFYWLSLWTGNWLGQRTSSDENIRGTYAGALGLYARPHATAGKGIFVLEDWSQRGYRTGLVADRPPPALLRAVPVKDGAWVLAGYKSETVLLLVTANPTKPTRAPVPDPPPLPPLPPTPVPSPTPDAEGEKVSGNARSRSTSTLLLVQISIAGLLAAGIFAAFAYCCTRKAGPNLTLTNGSSTSSDAPPLEAQPPSQQPAFNNTSGGVTSSDLRPGTESTVGAGSLVPLAASEAQQRGKSKR